MGAVKDNSLRNSTPQSLESLLDALPLFTPTGSSPPSRSIPSRSPHRRNTDPSGGVVLKTYKRIIICCDGTWQDGISQTTRSKYTNVLKLARSIVLEDVRLLPPISQVVFYQSGIGSAENFYSRYVQGTTGSSLGDKVEQAYAFIAQNYNPGDEIFLFGFSRGAYTARMVAHFIGEIGVLDCRDMDSFAQIFTHYQTLGKTKDLTKKKLIESQLAPWRNSEAHGKKRVLAGGRFMIKFLGVWDTVGALGLPGPFRDESNIFGFNDSLLGDHIGRACQALALNETRLDFVCNKFNQMDSGREKGQYVKQVWFTGAHSDIGGGYNHHDLADLALIWMAEELHPFLSLDLSYIHALIQPVAPWGVQQPHNSKDGIFALSMDVKRPLPTQPNDPVTHEFIHESVIHHNSCPSEVKRLIDRHPELVCPLGAFETAAKDRWPYDENNEEVQEYLNHLHHLKTRTAPNWLGHLVKLFKPYNQANVGKDVPCSQPLLLSNRLQRSQ